MHTLDRYIASTQRWVTVLYAMLFVASLMLLLFLPRPLDDTVKTVLIGATTALSSVLMMQNTFWFGRPRASGVPDPTFPATDAITTTEIKK